MVMRNRDEGGPAPHWWDDLPPKVRDRFTPPFSHTELPTEGSADPVLPISRGELLLDLSRLAGLFILIALGNILFLLVALSFVNG